MEREGVKEGYYGRRRGTKREKKVALTRFHGGRCSEAAKDLSIRSRIVIRTIHAFNKGHKTIYVQVLNGSLSYSGRSDEPRPQPTTSPTSAPEATAAAAAAACHSHGRRCSEEGEHGVVGEGEQ